MSTFGSTASRFAAWLSSTREVRATPAKEIINETQKNSYFMGELVRNRPESDIFRFTQLGQFWEDRIIKDGQGNFAAYEPGSERTVTRVDTSATIRVPARFYENAISYTETETRFNTNAPDVAKWKDFSYWLKNNLFMTHLNGFEAALWLKPDFGKMESGSTSSDTVEVPGAMYSIPALITEDGAGAPANNGTWSRIHGQAVSNTWWRNPYSTYNTGDLTTLFPAFDDLMLKLEFQTVPGYDKYMENDNLSKVKVCTNTNGKKIFMDQLRDANDQTRAGPQDPSYGMPVYHGYPVVRIKRLDEENLEQNPCSTTDGTPGTYTNVPYPDGRPRFFWLNLRYLIPIFDNENFFRETDPINGGIRQRDAFAMFMVTWANIACRSRRRGGGVIRPSA